MGRRRVGYGRDVEAVTLEGRVAEGVRGGCAKVASIRLVDGLTGTRRAHRVVMGVGVVLGVNDDCPADGERSRMVPVELVTLEKEPAEDGLHIEGLPIWQMNG